MIDIVRDLPGLNLLSLDGGGITGLSSLLIIKEIMARLQSKGQQSTIPKPCEYFDMIAGTGTGAISAVLLGRLHMSIDDAIASYIHLMKTVFSERKCTIKRDTGKFKSTVLEKELKEMILRAVGNENERMVEEVQADGEVQCKVVVYAMSAYNLTSSFPVTFRSYSSSIAAPTTCTIWEALRATTSHPQLFKSVEVDVEGTGLREIFVHGGLGCSNPTPRLLEEARKEYSTRVVSSIVSIGSGHPKTIQIAARRTGNAWVGRESTMMKVMLAAHEMAEGSERVAEELGRRFTNVERVYWRLNVQHGTQGLKASEWSRLGEIASHTRTYLEQHEIEPKLNELANAISQRTTALETIKIDGCIVRALDPTRGGIRGCPLSSIRFTGREKHTEKVRVYFTSDLQGRYVFVLYGLGGAGKTQIALKCAEELRERFMHIFFVDASSDKSVQTSLATIALNNNLGKTHEDTLDWIARHGRNCLLILDNADDPSMNLRVYLPKSEEYNVLVTTRCLELAALARDSEAVCNVSGLEKEEAVELLVKTAKLRLDGMNDLDKASMYRLLKSFEYLALAVVQAGAYIWKMQLSISQYWDKYSTRRQKLPESNVNPGLDGYPRTVYTTWELNLNQLSRHAKELLFLMAFLHRDGIVEEIFQRAACNMDDYKLDIQKPPERLEVEQEVKRFLDHLTDGTQLDDGFGVYMGELMSFSLATYDRGSKVYAIHPLVQDWAQVAASPNGILLQHTSLLLALSIGRGKSCADYAYKRQILPHVDQLHAVIEQNHVCDTDIADWFAEVYHATGQYHNEARLWERAISVRKQQLGDNHPRTLAGMSNLARAYQELGNRERAKELLQSTSDVQRHKLGEDHPESLVTKHRLAWLLHLEGREVEAEALLTTVVASQKQTLGDDHPDTLESMDDLASTYKGQGRLEEAEKLRMTVMSIRKQVFGENHPDTLQSMHNLAMIYQCQGRLKEAEAFYLRVVASRKQVLGEDHPNTLNSMHNLAYMHQEQGQLTAAESLYIAVIASRKQVLGDDHPLTLSSMYELAYTYQEQGQLAAAESLYLTVVTFRKRVLGDDHPHTLDCIYSLAYAYQEQGRLSEAESLYTDLIAVQKSVFGEDHPDTLLSMHKLASTYQQQGRMTEAEVIGVKVLDARRRVLQAHPDTIQSMQILRDIYYGLERPAEGDALRTELAGLSSHALS
ncbi:hypothetical protein B0J17DRAFT_674129 [Rhizoctonia solani]|nr:hypothetical protein B0J17DRAFT_674129 [Rhizoctonia solani]